MLNILLSDSRNKKILYWKVLFLFGFVICSLSSSYIIFFSQNKNNLFISEVLFSSLLCLDLLLIYKFNYILPIDEFQLNSHQNNKKKKIIFKSFLIEIGLSLPILLIIPQTSNPLLIFAIFLVSQMRVLRFKNVFEARDLMPGLVKLLFASSICFLALNNLACIWQFLEPFPNDLDSLTKYNKAFYWAVTTLTTVGYGDITPSANLSRAFTMIVMIIGIGAYGVIIGSVSKMLVMIDRYKEKKKEKLNDLNTFFNHYRVPVNLQKDVYSFYGHLLEKNISDIDNRVINELPASLQDELKLYMKIKLIKDVEIFKRCSIKCLKMISTALKESYYSPGQTIVQTGDIGAEMFIINHGEVEISVNNTVVANLVRGQFFGEIALLEETTRTADVKAKNYCDMLIFDKSDFLEVIGRFPDLKKIFEDTYLSRKKSLKVLNNQNNNKKAA